ncbi:MAG: hypothetical protein LWW85_11220 [Marinilabiliales bacterium]|nr:hypothetical protein [Marinilabiliales bacterium]
MKKAKIKLFGMLLLGFIAFSCSKSTTDSTTPSALKDALTSGTQNLNTAVTAMANSQAFQLLGITDNNTLKSGTVYTANIPLDLIKGNYNYTPLKTVASRNYDLIKFFAKTANTTKMVVSLPLAKIKDPRALRVYQSGDSTLANNFTIAVSDYHNNYNSYHDYDYVNIADVTIDNVNTGTLNIKSVVNPTTGTQYASSFAFSNGYTGQYAYASGDTTVSSFTILKSGVALYKEELKTIKSDTARFGREHQYTLTIGDVKLVRKAKDVNEVYLKGVLQTKAKVTMVDKSSSTEPSVCHDREIQITFDDGTTATLSTLISSSITDITSLFNSLHNVYFAAYVVDWLGYDIYYKR